MKTTIPSGKFSIATWKSGFMKNEQPSPRIDVCIAEKERVVLSGCVALKISETGGRLGEYGKYE